MGERRLYENRTDGTVWLEDGGRFWEVGDAANQAMQLLSMGVAWRPAEPDDMSDRIAGAVEIGHAFYDAPGQPASELRIHPGRAGPDARRLLGLRTGEDLFRDPVDARTRVEALAVANGHNLAILSSLMEGQDIGEIAVTLNGRDGHATLEDIAVSPDSADGSITVVDGFQAVVRGPDDTWIREPAGPLAFAAAMKMLARDIADRANDDWSNGPGGRATVMVEGGEANLDLGIREQRLVHPDYAGSIVYAEPAPLDDRPEAPAP